MINVLLHCYYTVINTQLLTECLSAEVQDLQPPVYINVNVTSCSVLQLLFYPHEEKSGADSRKI